MYINNVCLIGEWLSKHQKGESISICPLELGEILHPLFIKKWAPNQSDYEIKKLRNLVLKAYIYLSKTASSEISKVVDDVCQKIFDSNPFNSLLDAGFYYYTDNNARQKQWYEYWLGNDGRVWEESIGERNRIIQQFIRVVRLYDTSKSIDITAAVENARWSVIGYSSHKEYTCNYLLKWYNSLVEKRGKADFTISSQIKDVSDKIEEIGDNRSEYILNCKVFGDLFSCDFETIKDNLHCNHYLSQCFESPVYLVDGLIGYLKDGIYDQTSLLKIWAIGMSILDWKDIMVPRIRTTSSKNIVSVV